MKTHIPDFPTPFCPRITTRNGRFLWLIDSLRKIGEDIISSQCQNSNKKQFCCFVSNLFTHSQISGMPSTSLSQQQYFNQSNFSQRCKEASIMFNVISRGFHCGPCQCLSVLVGSISSARAA